MEPTGTFRDGILSPADSLVEQIMDEFDIDEAWIAPMGVEHVAPWIIFRPDAASANE